MPIVVGTTLDDAALKAIFADVSRAHLYGAATARNHSRAVATN